VQEIFAIGGADREADAGGAAVEEAGDVGLGSGGFVRATLRGDGGGEAEGLEGVSGGGGGRGAPAGEIGVGEDAVARADVASASLSERVTRRMLGA